MQYETSARGQFAEVAKNISAWQEEDQNTTEIGGVEIQLMYKSKEEHDDYSLLTCRSLGGHSTWLVALTIAISNSFSQTNREHQTVENSESTEIS